MFMVRSINAYQINLKHKRWQASAAICPSTTVKRLEGSAPGVGRLDANAGKERRGVGPGLVGACLCQPEDHWSEIS
jgi:hypothetical protein